MSLTIKQQRFADEYVKDPNGTKAYKEAYPNIKKDSSAATLANRLLKNVEVRAYIDEQLEKMHNENQADANEVLEYLTKVMRGKETEMIPIGVGKGEQVIVENSVTAKDQLKAAELLGKRHALFTDKQELSGGVDLVNIVDDIPGVDSDA